MDEVVSDTCYLILGLYIYEFFWQGTLTHTHTHCQLLTPGPQNGTFGENWNTFYGFGALADPKQQCQCTEGSLWTYII